MDIFVWHVDACLLVMFLDVMFSRGSGCDKPNKIVRSHRFQHYQMERTKSDIVTITGKYFA